MTARSIEAGAVLAQEGDPITEFLVILEGEIHFRRDKDPSAGVLVGFAGQAVGVLPFSRLKTSIGRVWAVQFTRIADMDASRRNVLVNRALYLLKRLGWLLAYIIHRAALCTSAS